MTDEKIRFACSDYRAIAKNTLQGSFTITVEPVGLIIKDCLYHEKAGKEWIAFPARPYTGKDGKTTYAAFLDMRDWSTFQSVMVPRVKALAAEATR